MNEKAKIYKRCLIVSMVAAIMAGIETVTCAFVTFLTMLFQTDPKRDKFCLAVLGLALVAVILEVLILKNEKGTEFKYLILNGIVKLLLNITYTIQWHWLFLPAQIVIIGVSVFAILFIIKSWRDYMNN